MALQVETLATDELGDRSYVVHDGTSVLVVDPQRDIDRVTAVLDRLGLSVSAVAETHIHNDYLTGGLVLARSADVPYLVGGLDDVDYERTPVDDRTQLEIGGLVVRVIATPGHTPGHVAYVVTDDSATTAVFSGGSLLHQGVGRTDLINDTLTEELTTAQYRSARRLAAYLPNRADLYPTHGFGSFCSAGGDAPDPLVESDEDEFVRRTIAGFTPYPAYYVHMAPRNRAGVPAADLSEGPSIDVAALQRRLDAREWVVDLRSRRDFAADHLSGSIAVELGPQFATYLGWIYPYDEPLTLLGETAEQVAAAQRQLVRIGIERPTAIAYGPLTSIAPGLAHGSFRRANFAELADAFDEGTAVLDVRRTDERDRDGAIPGAIHMPLPDLMTRIDDLPGRSWWVHCASGFRATIAASLLHRSGYEVVLVDDSFASARDADLVRSQ